VATERGRVLAPELMQIARSCVWTEDAAAYQRALSQIPDEMWPAFEDALTDTLEWRARHPPLRQVKLARLRDEAARRRSRRAA
jgi:hypothetical protein